MKVYIKYVYQWHKHGSSMFQYTFWKVQKAVKYSPRVHAKLADPWGLQ